MYIQYIQNILSVVRGVVPAAETYNISFDMARVYCLPYSYVKSISQAKNQ